MTLPRVSLILALTFILTGCVGVSVNRSDGTAGRSGTTSNNSAEASVRLLAVDVEFARVSATEGATAAFSRYADSQSILLKASGDNLVGRDAVTAEFRDLPIGALTWTPRHAEVSAAGDLGWTWGDFVFRGPQGERVGRYVTVWRWRDGHWLIAADIDTTEAE